MSRKVSFLNGDIDMANLSEEYKVFAIISLSI